MLLSTLLSYLTVLGAGELESASLTNDNFFKECVDMSDEACEYANLEWYCIYKHPNYSRRFLQVQIESQETSDKEEWTVTGKVPRAHTDPRFTVKLHIQRRNCSSVEYEYDSDGSSFNTDAIGTEFHELNWWNDTRLYRDLQQLWISAGVIERVAWTTDRHASDCAHRYIKLENSTLGGLVCVHQWLEFHNLYGISQTTILGVSEARIDEAIKFVQKVPTMLQPYSGMLERLFATTTALQTGGEATGGVTHSPPSTPALLSRHQN